MKIFDSTLQAIERKLDLSIKRHAILSGNIANQETPNYVAREYDFGREIESALGSDSDTITRTNGRHMDIGGSSNSHVSIDKSTPFGADGNNVDLDIEMGKLSANSRDYNSSINLLTVKLKMLKAAVSGGKGGF